MNLVETLPAAGRLVFSGAPVGFDATVLANLSTEQGTDVLFVAGDDMRLARMAEALAFFAPDLPRIEIPAWDCLPYDRISPNPEIVSRRIDALSRLRAAKAERRIVLTTVSAILQRIPPREALAKAAMMLAVGDAVDRTRLVSFLNATGYLRVEAVKEPGDYAVRGGIIDVFPAGRGEPVRLDLFGDDIESIRVFDSVSQRTSGKLKRVVLRTISEVILNEQTIARFRSGYRELSGSAAIEDPLYAAVSAGGRHVGMEHWLPLFYPRLETLFDYVPKGIIVLDHKIDEAREHRLEMIDEFYAARKSFDGSRNTFGAAPYQPVPPYQMFIDDDGWKAALEARAVIELSPFAGVTAGAFVDAGGRPGVDFAESRVRTDVNLFDALAARIRDHRLAGLRVMLTAVTRGSRDRLIHVLSEHGLRGVTPVDTWIEAQAAEAGVVPIAVLALERGFATPEMVVITEQDLLGERLVHRQKKRSRSENFITEATSLASGDLVVHADHGIGRYEGLETVTVDGAPHDCLRILYAGNDKLLLPVENIDVISRYGSETDGVVLDRLGGANWQARKAKLKKRLRDMADALIAVAASRAIREAPALKVPEGIFDEFCARFPYTETEDQARAIADVIDDLAAGRPADRLICGDVGFGKTEVALRAAFVSVLEGHQVAVVVPTTLLAHQHFRTFSDRFAGFPVRIGELSRLVPSSQTKVTKEGLTDGKVDIVIGTHALLAKDIRFRDLGLLIVDEEQHFGVAHKERLKQLKTDVHVLTLTATPIPRTLQLALSGVRELSVIATPPVDRLAVRTFVMEFDPVVIREAILREQHRGGQTFFVCPRIEDLDEMAEALRILVPEVSIIQAHGRMAARELEAAVGAFYEGAHNVLLSTNIVESGLDLPSVNTIIIHRADMFGLSQLYQLRGRVGRGKVRAYAYLTLPPGKKPTPAAEKRLSVMQALDALGAGFQLASHDLDIRGAGNLLGDEQSGHIREVGIELYQQMLETAVAEAKGREDGEEVRDEWSPQLSLGLSVLIPETYVPDLGVRLGLYRRLGDLKDRREHEAFAAELIDRFGPLPSEVTNLLQVIAVKQLCRIAGVERVEAGPKGAVISFRNNAFANPAGLVAFIAKRPNSCKVRPDHKLVYRNSWETPVDRLAGVRVVMTELARLAKTASA